MGQAKLVLFGVLATGLVTSTVWAGEIEGSLTVANRSVAPSAENDHYWNAWNGFIAARESSLDIAREYTVVVRGSSDAEPVGCEYAIAGGDLMPRTMVVRAGARIRLNNTDGAVHELAIEGLEEGAALATAPGNARQLTVPAGGPYAVTDALYGHVHGVILPLDDLAGCGAISSDGSFTIPALPVGDYVLTVYRNGEDVHHQNISVGEDTLEVPAVAL